METDRWSAADSLPAFLQCMAAREDAWPERGVRDTWANVQDGNLSGQVSMIGRSVPRGREVDT